MARVPLPIHGRGASHNPANRFEPIALEPDFEHFHSDEEALEATSPRPPTQYLRDSSRSLIVRNDSPDVGFEFSVNPYRGCEHGCVYCYARPTHEYFGLSAGLDFETKIFVKLDAPVLLRRELMRPRWNPVGLAFSGVTDCYQPVERNLRVTRGCLEVLREFRSPLSIVTKNHLVTRDLDVLGDLARDHAAMVFLSITTLDAALAAKMEPRTSAPSRRLAAISECAKAGVPVGVMVAPLIPGLNDHEMPSILEAAAGHGARFAGYIPLRLPGAVAPLFQTWLDQHFPDRKGKVLNRIRRIRGGRLNTIQWFDRMRGTGEYAEQFRTLFDVSKRRYGLDGPCPALSTEAFRRPGEQLGLFDGG